MLTIDQIEDFDRDGFVLIEGMFSIDEVAILRRAANLAARVREHTDVAHDADGNESPLAIWSDIGADVFGMVSASPRIVNSMRALLREDVYHWHSKVMLKYPEGGGAWEWHQDYGYWYRDGCPYPRLASAMIAIDEAMKVNGCLKVMTGSHRLGRLDHANIGNQYGVEPERAEALESRLPVQFVEAKPGSALFFHCNLIHASEPNLSEFPRLAYICCYNAFSNIPILGQGHGPPIPIQLASDDAILQFARNDASE